MPKAFKKPDPVTVIYSIRITPDQSKRLKVMQQNGYLIADFLRESLEELWDEYQKDERSAR